MGRRISDQGRKQKGRGTGERNTYIPWVWPKDFSNKGTASVVIDPETGRQVVLLSRGELYWWYMFWWNDDVEEIREQYPLSLERTQMIADQMGIAHPKVNGEPKIMTTDLLLIMTNGTKKAVSVKSSPKIIEKKRDAEKLALECCYWEGQGVPFRIAYRTDVPMTFVNNIIDVVGAYHEEDIRDVIGLARYMIAHKIIEVDMRTEPLDYISIIKKYDLERIWKNREKK